MDSSSVPGLDRIVKIAYELGVGDALMHSLEGKASIKDIVELYRAPLWLIGAAARAVTDSISGKRVGFIVNVIFNYTNVCVIGCKFCAFYRRPGASDSYRIDVKESIKRIEEYWRNYRIRQVLFQGGVDPGIPIEYYEEAFRGIKSSTRGEVAIHGLSVVEIEWLAKSHGVSIKELVTRLKEAGLDSVPGGGAEILSNRVRKLISPIKSSAEEWLAVMDQVMELGIPISATMVYGHIETLEERAEHLLKLLELQRRRGLILAFTAWNFEPENTELSRDVPYPLGGTELLRTVAIARLVFRDELKWIQAGWLTAGTRLGQVSLDYGANDWGGTLYEERVMPAAGVPLPHLARESIMRTISGAGDIGYERDNWYRPIMDK